VKVYIVARCYTEPEYMLEAVFSTKEKADAFIASKEWEWPEPEVQAWGVDDDIWGAADQHKRAGDP
jgi:hypothetical protein